MCNRYSARTKRDEIRDPMGALRDLMANQPTLHGIYPDYEAPIVRMRKGERIMVNVRNTASPHWRRWLGAENLYLMVR